MNNPPKILVVDDEAHILQVLTLKLRNAGYEVWTASDGEEGYEQCCRVVPDLVITDFQMPYMTGLELVRALARSSERSGAVARIPVMLLTARGYALDERDLAAPGMGNIRDVLSKPFSPRAIVQRVGEVLEGRGTRSTADGSQGGSPLTVDSQRSTANRSGNRSDRKGKAA